MMSFKSISYIFLFVLFLSACSKETISPESEPKGIYGELKSGINQEPIQGTRIYLISRNVSFDPHGPNGTTIPDIKYESLDSTDTDINGKFSFEKAPFGKIGIYISDRQNIYSLADSTDHILVDMDATTYEFIELEAEPTPIRDSFEIELEIYNVINKYYFGLDLIEEDYFLTHPIKISSFRTETQEGILERRIPLETKSITSDSSGVINLKFKFIKGYSDIFYSLNNEIKFIAHEMDDINDIPLNRGGIRVSFPLFDTLSYRKYTVDYYDIDEYYGGVSFDE